MSVISGIPSTASFTFPVCASPWGRRHEPDPSPRRDPRCRCGRLFAPNRGRSTSKTARLGLPAGSSSEGTIPLQPRTLLFTRRLILSFAGARLLSGRAAAEPSRPRRIACLSPGSHAFTDAYFGRFRQGLRALGYSDQDVEIDTRYADGHTERLAYLLTEMLSGTPGAI